jgi:hypothetical protein
MHVFALPAGMILVWVETPAKNKMLTTFVRLLDGAHGLFDQFRELAIGIVAALIGGIDMLGVGLHAGQRRAPLAKRRLAGALALIFARVTLGKISGIVALPIETRL